MTREEIYDAVIAAATGCSSKDIIARVTETGLFNKSPLSRVSIQSAMLRALDRGDIILTKDRRVIKAPAKAHP